MLDETQYGFETSAESEPPLGDAFALIREAGGLTTIRPGQGWARITLTIHSSLEAVGLTAAVAGALAKSGIAANMVAAVHHDHVFVPWARRGDAMAVLHALATGWTPTSGGDKMALHRRRGSLAMTGRLPAGMNPTRQLAWLGVAGVSLGAIAIGAVAIGALAIGSLRIKQARIGKLRVDELEIGRLTIRNQPED